MISGKAFFERTFHRLRIGKRRLIHTVRIFTRYSFLNTVSVRHNHNHRFSFSLRYQVVKYLNGSTQLTPGIFITSRTMQQV